MSKCDNKPAMPKAKSAREAALFALQRFRRNNAWSEDSLSGFITKHQLDRREAALASRLCLCVLQNMALCDFYIDNYSTVKTTKLQPQVLDILRISVCQILFFHQIPDRAAVSEAVRMCKSDGFLKASGLVNGVLRRISENKAALPVIPGQGTAEYLSIGFSHPLWLVREYISQLGYEDTRRMLDCVNGETPVMAQVNVLKTDSAQLCIKLGELGISALPHPWMPNCILIKGSGDLSRLEPFKNGEFYVQDPAARLAAAAAGVKPGMTVLDACAAPGGKSFYAAIMMNNYGKIVSCDINEKKLGRIVSGGERLGLDIIRTRAMDARQPDASMYNSFDAVIADAPCSGLGVIRKKPDIRYKNPRTLENLPAIQLAVLEGAAKCTAPGGVLVYSTCTTREEENCKVIRAFLDKCGEFEPECIEFPYAGINQQNGMVTLWPHLHGTDGFFICKLRKKI